MVADIARVPYHESTIISRLEELAQQITTDYADKDLTVDSILNGSFIFMADLPHRFPLPQQIDSWSASSYHGVDHPARVIEREFEVDFAAVEGHLCDMT